MLSLLEDRLLSAYAIRKILMFSLYFYIKMFHFNEVTEYIIKVLYCTIH